MQLYLLTIATILVHVCCNTEFILQQYESLLPSILRCDHSQNLNLDVSKVKILFYNGTNDGETYLINDAAQRILEKNLNFNYSWIIYVIGFSSSPNGPFSANIINELRKVENSYTIVVDHTAYTHASIDFIGSYKRSVKYAYYIGVAISKVLVKLHKGGVSEKKIRAIGHSLGGQILGYTGYDFKESTGCLLSRITGLDPAGPCFSNEPDNINLRKGEADLVEVIHCNAGGFGTTKELGDAEYFANKRGKIQPGCSIPVIATCSHLMCVSIYAKTVNNKSLYKARKCDSYNDFVHDQCSGDGQAGFRNTCGDNGKYYFRSTKGSSLSDLEGDIDSLVISF